MVEQSVMGSHNASVERLSLSQLWSPVGKRSSVEGFAFPTRHEVQKKRDEMKLIPCDSFNVDWSILVTRLQAVPFWLVERVHSQHSETGAKPSSDRDD